MSDTAGVGRPVARQPGVAERGRDACDRAEERQLGGRVARSVAAEQLDLHRVHRVDVGVAQIDRPAQDRLPLEQAADARRGQDARDRALVLALDLVEELGVRTPARDSRARSGGSTSRGSSRDCRPPRGRTAAARTARGAPPRRPMRTPTHSRTTPAAARGSASTRTPTGSRAATTGSRRRSDGATAGTRSPASRARRPV